jgi:predicted nucleotidyltransferase
MGKPRVDAPREKIVAFCEKWDVREFAFFGSVLTDNFRSGSDIDIFIDFKPGARRTLFDLVSMTDELKDIFGREVDLLTKTGVQQSRNYIRRKAILSSLEVVYAAA